jgi:hypothetical protein
MIVIAIAAMLCGADCWVAIAAFGRPKEGWLRQFLELSHGIPSHDTFRRVFAVLAPGAFEACFRSWAEAIRSASPGTRPAYAPPVRTTANRFRVP